MERLKYFFGGYFPPTFFFNELDAQIQDYKESERENNINDLIAELYQIITTKNYDLAAHIILKHGYRTIDDLEATEAFIKYIYDRFLDIPTEVQAEDFCKKFKCTFCPRCTPKIVIQFGLIQKATVIGKNLQIFICKNCKAMWPTRDIRAGNAQDYKKFMQSLGLKGVWKELDDVDRM